MRGVVMDRTKNFKKASKTNDSWVPRIILCALLCSIPKTENCCHLFWLSSMAVQSTLICERLHQFQFWTSLDFHQKLRCILYTFYNKKPPPPIYHKKELILALTLFQTFHISASESDTDPVDLSLFFWHSTFFLIVRLKSKKNIKSLAYQIQFVVWH